MEHRGGVEGVGGVEERGDASSRLSSRGCCALESHSSTLLFQLFFLGTTLPGSLMTD